MIIQPKRTYILRPTQWGRRLFPIDQDELDKMLEAGTARKVKAGLYETRQQAAAQAPEDLDSVPDEEPQVYQTRDLLAQPKRRRGRPPGSKNKPKTTEPKAD